MKIGIIWNYLELIHDPLKITKLYLWNANTFYRPFEYCKCS